MSMLQVIGLGHTYTAGGTTHEAIDNVSFTVEASEIVCVVGPSGCGKSTLLRCIAGLITPSRGTVLVHGEPVGAVRDDLAVVFQDFSRSLLPWKTVAGNVEFPLHGCGLSATQRRERVHEALAWVGLRDAAAKHPGQLSGGMQQRVSIARALAYRPSLVLMDEPFASVDAHTRAELEDLVLTMRDEANMTVLLVTHDIDESVYLADRVLVLSAVPSTVQAVLDVDIPSPQDQVRTRGDDAFVRLRTDIATMLRPTDNRTTELC
jgi:NitT/TauT family transport system ATP-binding protein